MEPCGTVIWKLPSKSEMVPLVVLPSVPFWMIPAPIIPAPFSSSTTPLTWMFCDQATAEPIPRRQMTVSANCLRMLLLIVFEELISICSVKIIHLKVFFEANI